MIISKEQILVNKKTARPGLEPGLFCSRDRRVTNYTIGQLRQCIVYKVKCIINDEHKQNDKKLITRIKPLIISHKVTNNKINCKLKITYNLNSLLIFQSYKFTEANFIQV